MATKKNTKLTPWEEETLKNLKSINEYKEACEANIVGIIYKNPDLLRNTNLDTSDFTNNCWRVYFEIAKELIITEKKQTALSNCLTYLARYGNENTIEYITKQLEFCDDKKKHFYTISDYLLRFYFAYVFGCSSSLSFLGPEVFYKEKIEPSVSEFISRRFEEIARQYFMIQVRTGKRRGIQNVGTFWYDDPKGKKSNEFDCVLKRREGYDFYECRFMKNPLTRGICDEEKEQIQSVSDILHPVTIGFISASGFSFQSDQYDLISGDDLFDE